MSGRSKIAGAALAALLAACVAEPPAPINSPAFAVRAPLPGEPGYLDTIGFIDNGIKYVSVEGGFFVSAFGEMCFQGIVNPGMSALTNYLNYWCIDPRAVGAVDALENGISYINAVRLWCRHSAPQCAHKVGYANMLDEGWVANSITAQTVPFRQQKAALVHLIYLMGGGAGPEPLRWPKAAEPAGR
jgi:hypothetical protein